jgi:hypothetical protein
VRAGNSRRVDCGGRLVKREATSTLTLAAKDIAAYIPEMPDRVPYKGRNLDIFRNGDCWAVEIIDVRGMRSIVEARTLERAINAAYQKIDEEDGAVTAGQR